MKKNDDFARLGIDKNERTFWWLFISKMMLLVAWLYGFLVSKVINKIKFIGQENVPRSTNILFVSNHYTYIDSFLIAVGLYRFSDMIFNFDLIYWNLPATENFYQNPISRFIFSHLKNIPAVRAKGLSADEKPTLTQIKETINLQKNAQKKAVEEGNLLYFIGEGRDDGDDEIKKCKRGAASLIYDARPKYVVPILLQNLRQMMPEKKFRPIRGLSCGKKGQIIFGKPVMFDEFFNLPKNNAVNLIRQKVTDCISELKKDLL